MSISDDKDLYAEALTRLPEFYKGKTKYAALLEVYSTQMQEAQAVLLTLLALTSITDSEGAQLDGIGTIVGEPRHGRDDAAYRLALRTRILINTSSGTIEELLAIVRAVLGDGPILQLVELGNASMNLVIDGAEDEDSVTSAAIFLKTSRGAAIGTTIEYSLTDDAHTFTFSDDDTEESSTDEGWADDAQTSGGEMADVIEA